MKFRKKPIVIEAYQWSEDSEDNRVKFTGQDDTGADYYAIKTLEGWMRVIPGDWVITGIHGEAYPCKNEIFLKSYEAVE